MINIKYDKLIDIKGLCCSAPVIVLSRELKPVLSKQVVLIISDKSSMLKDIPAYCKMKNLTILQQNMHDGLYRFWVQKDSN